MQPPGAPPQWSADGQWWWDGTRWRPRSEGGIVPPTYRQPTYSSPTYWQPPQLNYGQLPSTVPVVRSPGFRILLLVVLILDALLMGFLALGGLLSVIGGDTSAGNVVLFAFVGLVFAAAVLATVGVAIRASWSRVAAIVAGIAISLTCVGLVLGIPILIAAARAPDLRSEASGA